MAAITCPALVPPQNGQLIFTTDIISDHDFGTVATYLCDTGYAAVGGDARRVCSGDGSNTNGTWTGVPPTCEGI